MKKFNLRNLSIAFLTIAFLGFQSCSKDGMSGDGETLSQAELQTILNTDDIAGAVDTALAEIIGGNSDESVTVGKEGECYSAEYTETGFVATFNNCMLNGTDNINGTVTATYEVGSEMTTFTATYQDFYVGNIKVNGTRTFEISSSTEQTSVSFSIISDMSIEMEDGSVISENGTKTFAYTRQMSGCKNNVEDYVLGTKGRAMILRNSIEGTKENSAWRYRGPKPSMYDVEHKELFAAIRSGNTINNGQYMTHSTLMAIMGREACYTGQEITSEQMFNSKQHLAPTKYAWGDVEIPDVAQPGRTKLT